MGLVPLGRCCAGKVEIDEKPLQHTFANQTEKARLSPRRSRTEGIIVKGELLRVLIDVPRYETPLQVELVMVRWSNGHECGMEFLGMPTGGEIEHDARGRDAIS